MASFQDRVIGALKLSPATFDDVRQDTLATGQAAIVVVAGSVASALGSFWFLSAFWVVRGMLLALLGWAVFSGAIFIVGTKLLPGKSTLPDPQQVLRPLGFAYAPQMFAIVGVVPILGALVRLVAGLWALVATVIAVRSALGYGDDTIRAVLACLIAFVAAIIVMMIVSMLVGAGTFMF